MKRLKNNIRNILGLASMGALLLSSCSDDVMPGATDTNEADNAVVIYVPDVNTSMHSASSTRSEGTLSDAQDAEKVINKFNLFAYPVEEGKGEATPVDLKTLTPLTSVPSDLEGYTGYKIELPNGKYRFYLVANVTFSDADITKETMISEGNLKNYTVTPPTDATAGIPMSCANGELLIKNSSDAQYSEMSNSGLEITSGKGVRIKADLTFAVAKVRVTLLNDLLPSKTVESTKIINTPTLTDLFTGSTNTPELKPTDFSKKGYYLWGDTEMKDNVLDVAIDGLTPTNTAPADKWIWQGTAYLGERLFAEADEDKPEVTINFTDKDSKPLPLGSEEKGGLRRSYFYDYVGTPTTEFKLAVQKWTPETIRGALHGEYFLHVDKTEIDEIESGNPVAIWYESNAALKFDFGKINKNGKQIDVYTYKLSNDTIYLSINSQIGATDVIDKAAYGSFTVTAGTIEKKLTVGKLNLKEYLTLDKKNVSIDVREQIASGHYSNDLSPITISTNLKEIKITKGTWSRTDENENVKLKINDSDVTFDSPIQVDENGEVKISVSFKNLNEDAIFWKDRRTFTFYVKGQVNGKEETEEVTINLIPSVDDYEIHLYAPGWTNAHIYVYQCLKLPSTHPDYPNGPVGTDDAGNTAALEYCFTGAVAFRGWGVKGSDDINHNDPSKKVEKVNNFLVFNEYPTKGDWNPGTGNWEHHYYDMDFCEEYRTTIDCAGCGGTTIDRDWPGIKMENEGDGWWKFTLSGVAKPGQALIMFTDATNNSEHYANGEGGCMRYPQNNEPGIPLFDFPSNVGYLDLTASSKQFVETKPQVDTNVAKRTIYFTNPDNWSNPYIYVFHSILTGNNMHDWPGVLMTKVSDNLWMYEFDASYSKVIFSNNGADKTGDLILTEGNMYDKNGAYYPNAVTVTDPDAFPVGKYRLTTSNATGFSIWVWTDKENVSDEKNETWDNQYVVKSSAPYEFSLKVEGAKILKYKKNKGDDIEVKFSSFHKEGDTYVLNID